MYMCICISLSVMLGRYNYLVLYYNLPCSLLILEKEEKNLKIVPFKWDNYSTCTTGFKVAYLKSFKLMTKSNI